MFGVARRLRENGVLGLNWRNGEYLLPNNARRLYPLVDDKLKTKRLAQAAGVGVPPLYGVIEYAGDVRGFAAIAQRHPEFVIKPAGGSGGDGIVIIRGRMGGMYRKASGALVSRDDLEFHIYNALGGIFTLGGQPDRVLIEYCIQFDPVFERISFEGVPDIRIIVFLGVPVMAMVRLPTRQSGGRANLHQGAIGAGVDMRTGTTMTAVLRQSIVADHPDTGEPVGGVVVPHWNAMLEIAARTYEMTGLGYQGVDLVIDRSMGPVMLEINARPGLAIQIANRAGLGLRLEKARAIAARKLPPAERAALARELFASAG